MEQAVFGRELELAAIREFVDGLDAPRALLLEGEAGIGKTTLWREGVRVALGAGTRVLECQAVEAESRLSFAALAELLAGAAEAALSELPPPQRRALSVALLLEEAEGPPPEARAVAAAFLGVLRSFARDSAVLIAVDDTQWVDAPSARVLEYVARRLREEPVALLLTRRPGRAEQLPLSLDRALPDDRLNRLVLGPLSLGALHRMLHGRLGVAFARPALLRIRETAAGNPFYALELARAIEAGGAGLDRAEPLRVPDSVHELVEARLERLAPKVRDALVVVAALAQPTLDSVEAAGAGGVSIDDAVTAGVLEVDGDRLRFTHPLLASAVYTGVGPNERRALHRRLSASVVDPEQRARHLALASAPPDGVVAELLDAAATAAAVRGAPETAAELADQACRFTPPEQQELRSKRQVAAAEHHFQAGDTVRARALLEEAVAAMPAGPARAAALVHLAIVLEAGESVGAAVALYGRALVEAGADRRLQADIRQRLAWSLLHAGDVPRAAEHARAAVELADDVGDASLLALILSKACVIQYYLGNGLDRAAIDRAVALEDSVEHEGIWLEERPSTILGAMLLWDGDVEAAEVQFETARRAALESGSERALPMILYWLSCVAARRGAWERVRELASEGDSIAVQTGQEPTRAALLFSIGLADLARGDVESARAAATEGLAIAERSGDMIWTFTQTSFLGQVELAATNYQEAYRALRRAVELHAGAGIGEPSISAGTFGAAIEAAVKAGELDWAESILVRLERSAVEPRRPWILAFCGRSRGLLAAERGSFDDAFVAFGRAVEEFDRLELPFERARTLAALGSAQRRAKLKGAARQSLTAAIATFDDLGATLRADDARAELARIGGRTAGASELTPTESRVAALVAEGRPNKEVAAALSVTPKTIEYHLGHVYEKLGVHSRTELAHRLAASKD